jgi:hypothetical protein
VDITNSKIESNLKKKNKIRIIEYIKFYNEARFQKRLRCMAPLEYRNHAS